MLRIAILENEDAAKNIMFSLAQYLQEEDCCFYCFKKISQFAKVEKEKEFHVVVFHEKMEIPRVTQSFVLNKPQRIIIYTKTGCVKRNSRSCPLPAFSMLNEEGYRQI